MRHCRPNMGCGMPTKTIVHPTKCNEVHTCSESLVNHVHPSHTNVVNHHLVKNAHYYPHTTSNQNTVNSVNVNGGGMMPQQMGPMNNSMNPMNQNQSMNANGNGSCGC